MKKALLFFLPVFIFLLNVSVLAEDNNGRIMGKILDGSSGTTLPDAVIKIEGLSKGTASDLDGKYELNDLKGGPYIVKASYVGYVNKTINLELKPGETLTLDIILLPESTSTDTLTIEADRRLNNEASILLQQQKSDKISDGVSEQQVKKSPDASASDVMKRIIGVSIVSDKFVFVRGISERYSNTTLNGVEVPSTEPDKKAFSFDLFPSNLLENLIIAKSFSPDLPGNFSGGLVEITTKDIPDALTYSLSTSTSFSSNTTTLGNFLTYNGKEKKILFFNSGMDDGGRSLPGNFPGNTLISSNYSKSEIISFSKEFINSWGQYKTKAPLNGSFQISLGSRVNLFKNPLGFFAAYTYRNTFTNKNVSLDGYDDDNNLLTDFKGQSSVYKVSWGALLNLSYKIGDNNKLSIKNSYVLDGEDETQALQGYTQDFSKKTYSTLFKERTLRSIQVSGDHYIAKFSNLKINWTASYSDARRDEPDYKTLSYQRDPTSDDPNYYAAITTGSLTFDGGSRLFTKLFDISRLIKTDFEIPVKKLKNLIIKSGVLATGTRRTFSARLFAPQFYNYANIFTQQAILRQSIDSIFSPANIRDSALYYSEYTRGSDSYDSQDNLYAGYLMFDGSINKFRIVAGARLESYQQKLNSKSDSYADNVSVNLKNNDILPAINLTYVMNDMINLRASYYSTLR